jgi:bacteriocin biosynthesis cyclodehydratase domain-containing protein
MQPLLLPGTHVVRRGPDEIQVGLTRGAAVTLGRTSPRLDHLQADEAAVRTLRRSGLVMADDRPLRGALPPAGDGKAWVRHTLAAVARRTADRAADSLETRARYVVTVRTFGHPLGQELTDDLQALCRRSGLSLPGAARPGPTPRGAVPPRPLQVLIGIGEPTRDLLDDLVRESVPHLVVRLVEGQAVIGPFVEPGATACLRCIDAYLTEDDPAWPLVVEQYARCTRSDRSDGIPEPVDAALATVAVGWAARDVATYAEADRPTSWSSTTTLTADLSQVSRQVWPPHPHCGCAWG